jgi:hypothetical protein
VIADAVSAVEEAANLIETLQQTLAEPATGVDHEAWIAQHFTGHGVALRRKDDTAIPGEPFMSMAVAKDICRKALALAEPATGGEVLLVPRDPTDAMLDAAERVNFDNEDERGMACNLWSAMLAAAPTTPVRSYLVKHLADLIEAHDADCKAAIDRHGFVGAWAMGTFSPMRDWIVANRRAILAALSTAPSNPPDPSEEAQPLISDGSDALIKGCER